MAMPQNFPSKVVYIPLENLGALEGDLCVPPGAEGVVLFAHGSGSSRHSPRNRYIAQELQQAGLATLLFDLLTPEEEQLDEYTRRYRFDIGWLADRLVAEVLGLFLEDPRLLRWARLPVARQVTPWGGTLDEGLELMVR
ncbi:hypothetical protein [Meiothermus sp.]|uniref:hypothetical protein n=1 Tax=Meiothermus sp. TaxID=1955249 RepID=UPI0021DD6036|nr:hypothetical protein [Meiothermus sp.]GIW34138.1 MAG: hypothetical protein KatS3mg072_1471 [Meiothermus sp.]